MRAVLNPDSAAGRLLTALEARCTLIASLDMIEELAEVLGRRKLASRLPGPARRMFLDAFAAAAELVDPQTQVTDCRDPDDNKFLAAAVAGGATLLVTDDRDLLDLPPWREVRIVKPEAALAELSNES